MPKIKVQVETEINTDCGHECKSFTDTDFGCDYCKLFNKELSCEFDFYDDINKCLSGYRVIRCDKCLEAEKKSLQSTQSDIE